MQVDALELTMSFVGQYVQLAQLAQRGFSRKPAGKPDRARSRPRSQAAADADDVDVLAEMILAAGLEPRVLRRHAAPSGGS